MHCCSSCCVTVGVLILAPGAASADLGTLRLSTQQSGCQITVFTSPAPLRAGSVEVKVLLQHQQGSTPTARVQVCAQFARRQVEATAEQVGLFHVAILELDQPGLWQIQVVIDGSSGPIRAGFEAEVDDPIPPWQALAPWIAWPIVPIVLFVVHQGLARRTRFLESVAKG